jgi:hypothetical protein
MIVVAALQHEVPVLTMMEDVAQTHTWYRVSRRAAWCMSERLRKPASSCRRLAPDPAAVSNEH